MKRLFGLVIVLVLAFFIIRPLFAVGYFPMHDDTQVARVVVMGRALRQGQFPVRWVTDLGYGYGYPIFNFYGPLPYYVGGFFYALGLSGLVATKIMMAVGLVFAGVSMYLVLAEIIGISGGILAAVLYMFAPYHAVQAYVRGSVGEYYTLVFLPLIFWGFWKVYTKKQAISGILVGSVGIGGLIISHTILGYAGLLFVAFTGIVLGIYSLKSRRDTQHIKKIIFLIMLGLGLSAFFWLPAIAEMKYTNVASQITSTANFREHFVCPIQLWDSFWGFGGSAKGCLDGLSFKIGKEHLILGFIVLLAALLGFLRDSRAKYIVGIGFLILLLSCFFMLSISQQIWEILPLFSYVQYPWRFLTFAIFGLSLMASQIVYISRHKVIRFLFVVLSIAAVLFIEIKRFVPQYVYNRAAADFETATDIRYRASKISDEYLPKAVPRPEDAQSVVRDTIAKSDMYAAEIVETTDTYKKIAFHAKADIKVQVNTAYFPGWQYVVNIDEVMPAIEHGLPNILIPSGDSVLQMRFSNTPVRTIGNMLSFLSVGLFIYLYDKHKKTIS